MTKSNGVKLASRRTSLLSTTVWTLQPSLTKTLVSSSSTAAPDGTTKAIFCATALLQGLAMTTPCLRAAYSAAYFRHLRCCEVTSRPETRQGLGLILETAN